MRPGVAYQVLDLSPGPRRNCLTEIIAVNKKEQEMTKVKKRKEVRVKMVL